MTADQFAGLPPMPQDEADRLLAAVDMIGRTGAQTFQLRVPDDDDDPGVYVAVGTWPRGQLVHEAAASLDPLRAVLRLCEAVLDGGKCQHCQRVTCFEPDSLDGMPLPAEVCWYQYDPGTKSFVRGCA